MADPDRTQPATRPRGSQLRRYGPLVALGVVVVVGLVVAVVARDDDDDVASGADAGGTTAVGAPAPLPGMPLTYAEAEAEGTVEDHEWGQRCDPETGRLAMPSVYAPPCVPVFEGDNGGATAKGVTDDTIRVVRYQAETGTDLQSIFADANVNLDPDATGRTAEQYLEVYSSLAETYGREVELITYQASARSDDEVASRAAAVEIAEDIEPFVVLGGPLLDGGAFADELANRGVMCMGCSAAMPDQVLHDNAPLIWGTAEPSVDQMLENLLGWVQASDAAAAEAGVDEPLAEYAGSPQLREQPRRVGVVHLEQDPPVFDATAEANAGRFGRDVVRESYVFAVSNLGSLPEEATRIIAKMKDEGVTTILFLGDPIMPIYLTQAATAQDYFPEWIITGTGLTDSTQLARQYDPAQWAQAYGISARPARIPREDGDAWRLYEWYFGEGTAPPPAEATYATIAPTYARLMLGIHMAGPDLTHETMTRGLFRVPPTGGGPTTPQISYGNWGFFEATDYHGIDDATLIWWDAEAEGPDENGNEGTGMWRYANGGARFIGTSGDLEWFPPFVLEGSVTIYDERPPGDQPPSYPPPPGSPAAG